MYDFDRKQALKQRDKARNRDKDRLAKKTHKWVRTQHGMKLVRTN